MRTRWATPRYAAELLALLLQCFQLAEPSGRAGNDPFTIVHENTGKCIKPLNDWIVATDCDKTEDMLWKWVSQHRLFHLQTQQCLGLDISKPVDSLRMFSCNSNAMLWWKCEHYSLYGAAQSRLALSGGHAIASTNASDVWKKGDSGGNLCDQPYREIYTRDGNSYGKPCEFPFLVAGTWHHECILDEDHSGPWCATTLNYEYDQKWGICLNPENGCEGNWEKNAQTGSCYQFNTQTALTWKEAYVSCQNQGADLLSISSGAELTYLEEKEGIAKIFWIGLNQLYSSSGWEWSDHKPLNFLNWDPDMPSASGIGGSSCANMDATSGLWQRRSCEAQLPYVCEKPLNNTVELTDVWTYSDTRCDADWLPNNGFCYLLANESDSWDLARAKCKAFGSDLISIHSLADVEVVVTKLHNGDAKEETWTGLKNINTPALFQWSDGTEVTLTYWDENEPSIPYNKTPNCVSYLGKLGQWKVQSCEEKHRYVCKKKGEKMSDASADKMCPPGEGWKRHGETCYKIYKDEVPFGTNCNLTITSRFEQEFLNDMIKKYTKSTEKYFWTGLRDVDSNGEYSWASVGGVKRSVTFSNWNFLEPASPGGCVAMTTGKSPGKWEVKDCRSFRALSICKTVSGPAEPEEAAPKPEDPCPEGWENFPSGLSCYKLFHIERIIRKRNWEEAERFCQALGGHLPSFLHVEEIKEFLHFLMNHFSGERWLWIGLNKRSPDLQGSWQWSDRAPVSTFLMENEFQQDYDVRDCAAIKVMQRYWRRSWHYHYDRENIYLKPFACDTKLEWVCQIPKGCTPKTPDWYNPERAGIHGPPVVVDGSEYWFVADPYLNYEEAVLYCASNHSSLATLTSFAGLKAIKNKIANISGDEQKWWVRTPKQPIIDRHYMYTRHSWHHFPVTFGEQCLYLSAKTWLHDLHKPADCNTKLPFICEKYNVSSLEKYSPDSAAKIQCSGSWITFQNKCFLKIKPKSLSFSGASDTCHTYGGTLPTVLSQREQDFITSLLPDMEDDLWIGLRWTAHERINKWIDNRELTYSNFHPFLVGRRLRIPKDMFEEESHYHCALMLNHRKSPLTGTWNFTSCSEQHTVSLCQKYSEVESRQTSQNTSETVKYLNNLYKIIRKSLTWSEALRECQNAKMRLVSITDPYQQAFLTVEAVLYNASLWIGLSSQDDELNFVWSDGKHLQFSRWTENNEQLEDCVFLDTDGFWKTSDCDAYQPGAICYHSGDEIEREVNPVNSVRCPSPVLNTPWIPFQNYCYNFMIAKNRYTAVTQDDIHSRCQKLNPKSHILSIRDEKENIFVLEQLLHFNYMASWVVLGIIYENNSLMWSDKTMLSYTNWREGRPALKNGHFFVGLSTDGFWDIKTFNVIEEVLHFHQHSILACKIEMGKSHSSGVVLITAYGEYAINMTITTDFNPDHLTLVDYKEEYNTTLPQFIPYKDGIYSVIQKTVTWYEAVNTCAQRGGHLASVHDRDGQLFLEDVAKRDGFPLWVGLSSHDGTESDFEWSDGSALDYIPWKDKQSAGNCVLLDPKGIWKHEKCDSYKDGAICYKPTKPKEAVSPTRSSRCPADGGNGPPWVQYKGHCYAHDQALYSFLEARQFCSELGHSATIVTIKDEDENKFVSRLMRENNNITMRVWLGLSQHPADKSWYWLDGPKVTFARWANKRKSDGGKCSILLASNETWIKVECSQGYGRVVCKAPLGSDYRGVAITFAVLSVLALVGGLGWFLFQRSRLHWTGFSSVRYEQGVNEDEIMLPSFQD